MTAHEEEVKVREVLPGMVSVFVPKAPVTPLGKPASVNNAVVVRAAHAPGLPIVTVVVAVNLLGAKPS